MEEKRPLFSVCIPLYNTEKYIAACLDSVLGQDWTDYEVVLVNDGSTDAGPAIAGAYAEKDDRVRILSQENRGPFHTRMRLFQEARGRYVVSLDADDFLEPGALTALAEEIRKESPDMVVYSYYLAPNGGERKAAEPVFPERWVFREGGELRRLFATTKRLNAIWCKAIRRELLEAEAFTGYPRISMGDDWIASFYPMMRAEKFVYLPKALVNYRVFPESMTGNFDLHYWETLGYMYKLQMGEPERLKSAGVEEEDVRRVYLSDLAKAMAYVPGKVKDWTAYREMLNKLRASEEIRRLYGLGRQALPAMLRLPFCLLYARQDWALAAMKRLATKLRGRGKG